VQHSMYKRRILAMPTIQRGVAYLTKFLAVNPKTVENYGPHSGLYRQIQPGALRALPGGCILPPRRTAGARFFPFLAALTVAC